MTGEIKFARIPAKAASAKRSATDWAVLHAICLHADKDGRAFPSMARVAEIAGMKRKNIPRTIKRLEERGLLRRRRVPRPQGGWHNHYELIFESIRVLNPEDAVSEHVLNTEDAEASSCPQDGANRVLTGEALTDQGTDPYHEGKSLSVEYLKDEHVLTAEDAPIDPPIRCTRYVTQPTGFRICGKPAVVGGEERCAEHMPRFRASAATNFGLPPRQGGN